MSKREKKSLEQILLDYNVLTKEQIDSALLQCQQTGKPLKETLVIGKFISEDELVPYLAEQLEIPYVDLNTIIIHPEIVNVVPETIARKYKLVPVFKVKNSVTVAMVDPLDFSALDALKRNVKFEVKTVMGVPSSINSIIQKYYGVTSSIETALKEFDISALMKEIKEKGETPEAINKLVKEAPVVKLVDLIIQDAVRRGASDIHIEPEEERVSSRLRVDGILHESAHLPKILQEALVSRIKILAELDIAQKRVPQDGKIRVKTEGKDIDLRVSTYPGPFGEDVVMRVLDKTTAMVTLDKLGFSANNLKSFDSIIEAPNGIILVTGPTGSGKSTTLYSALIKINTPEIKIITIEDPIEYQMQGVRQSQINPKAGFTFANGLRAILRHDPDVIMVGEIRDLETAEISVQAALTGHLVFSTLHTNDAPSAATRLIDMGIEPFLIASSVLGVMAQRLIRTICPKCKESYAPPVEVLDEFKLSHDTKFYRGKGCNDCLNTGYSGRTMISEIMLMSNPIRELILKRASSAHLTEAACKEGMVLMKQDGINKVISGQTTIEEVLRVA
jgi:type IV pilus assembly protein PilB